MKRRARQLKLPGKLDPHWSRAILYFVVTLLRWLTRPEPILQP